MSTALKIVCGENLYDRKVFAKHDGEWVPVENVSKISIETILPGEPIKAQIEVINVELEIETNPEKEAGNGL